MSIRRLKRCFVPSCENTSENNKNKLFILLPSKPEIRKKWFTSINGKYITKTDLYACEDHFDLKNDMKNWVEYKLLAKRMFMKESAVPRFFINSPIPEKQKFVSQISDSERKRKREAMERYTEQVRRLAKRENNFNNENPDTRLIGNIGLSKKDYFVVLQPAINSDVDETLPTTSSANDTEVSKLFLVPEAFSPSINIVISAVPDHVDPPSASLRSVKMKQMLSSAENCYFDMTKPPSRSITTTNFTSYTAGRVPPIPSPISDKFKMNISHKLFDKEAKIKQELQEGVTIKFESVDIDETDLETDNKIDIRETCLAPIQEKVFKVDGYNEQFNDVEELKFMNTVSVNCDDHNLENIPGIQDEGFEFVREIIDEENELKQESYDNIDIKNEMDEVVTEYIFACSVCNEMYETKEELIEHKIETAECHEHKQCEKCGIKSEEGFACIWDLMQHMEAEHKVEHLAFGKSLSMVITDNGLPDPDDRDIPNEDIRVSNEEMTIVDDIDDNESDHESITLDERDQYQRLPSFPDDEHVESSEEEQENVTYSTTNETPIIPNIPVIVPMEESLVKEVWSEPHPKSCDIEMDSKKADEVRQVMMNITLPPGAIPDWAANIPEEEWKLQLMKRLENIQTRGDC